MYSRQFMDLLYIYAYISAGVAFVAAALLLSRAVAPHRPGKVKCEPYECGEEVTGGPWIQFNVRYYIFALLFLIFDVETILLFPFAVFYQSLLRQVGLVALVEMLIFVGILVLGLLYPWRKGILKWH